MFASLDISLNLCRELTRGTLAGPVRELILREFQSA
jgi:hypothetical protein